MLRNACVLTGIVVACALSFAAPGFTQSSARPADQYIQRAWGTPDGLPQNTITSMVQTRDGYLWLGTFGGLVRFDGQEFTVFDPGNTAGLVSSRVTALYEDKSGVLWIATEAGLARYEAGAFRSYTTTDGLPYPGIASIGEDARGHLMLGTEAGLATYDGRTFAPETMFGFGNVPLAGPSGVALTIATASNGDVWLGTWDKIVRRPDGETARVITGSGQFVRQFLFDAAGRLWAGGTGLMRWDGAQFQDIPFAAPAKYRSVTSLAADPDGSLWIGTARGGLYRWRDGIVDNYSKADGLTDNLIRSLLVDRDGNVWIGTDVGGLNRLKRRRAFNFPRPGSVEQSIGPIVDDGDGGLWIGATCGGLLHFRAGAFRVFDEKDGLPHNCIWALHRDADDTLWIGTAGAGLVRMSGGRFSTFNRPNWFAGAAAIFRDRESRLWVANERGLSRFEDGQFTSYGTAAGIPGSVSTITQDRAGALWLGSINGVLRFEDGHVTASYTTAQGLSHNHVRAIYEDADGVLWIGTYGGGLNRFKDGRFTTYGIKEGLPDIAVSRIIEDDRGFFWMSGNKGVFRVARHQLNDLAEGRRTYVTGVTYGTADGMVIDETNGGQPAGWRTADGKLWFPTIKGLVSIDPVSATVPPPPVFVERAIVNGASVALGAMNGLGPGQADAEIHYTAVDLGAAEKTRFRYRLDGYDPDWIEAGTRRVAYYTRIPPGRYRFEVVATDSDGAWSGAPRVIALSVTPFWWQRRDVQGAALVLLLLITGYLVRLVSLRRARARLAELEREREREQAVERERSRIARDLHDDLGSRLAQIALIAEDPQASRPSDQISGVAREAMQTMDELVWTVNARNDTVDSFAEFAAEFAEEHLRLAGVRYRLQFQPDLDGRRLAADTRRHLYLAFKEAINNVVKHAAASEVHVGLAVDAGMLVLDVTDNGRGLPPGQQGGTGNGLRNMRERMDAVGGTLAMESPGGAGTRLVFRAPLTAEARI